MDLPPSEEEREAAILAWVSIWRTLRALRGIRDTAKGFAWWLAVFGAAVTAAVKIAGAWERLQPVAPVPLAPPPASSIVTPPVPRNGP